MTEHLVKMPPVLHWKNAECQLHTGGITYLMGDATFPQGSGVKIVCHICNDVGVWGAGFVLAISKRWHKPEDEYRKWHRLHMGGANNGFALGAVQFVQVDPEIWIANMVGQHGIKQIDSVPPIRYKAVDECLRQVADKALELNASVHMPRIGCGLAGGDWFCIKPLIVERLCKQGLAVTVYDFVAVPEPALYQEARIGIPGDGVSFALTYQPTCYRRGPWLLQIEVDSGPAHHLWGCLDAQDQPWRYYHHEECAKREADALAAVLLRDRLKGSPRKDD